MGFLSVLCIVLIPEPTASCAGIKPEQRKLFQGFYLRIFWVCLSSHAVCALLYLLAAVRAAEQLLEFAQGFFSLPAPVYFGTLFDPHQENSEVSNKSDALIPGIVTARRSAASPSSEVVTRGAGSTILSFSLPSNKRLSSAAGFWNGAGACSRDGPGLAGHNEGGTALPAGLALLLQTSPASALRAAERAGCWGVLKFPVTRLGSLALSSSGFQLLSVWLGFELMTLR